MLEANCIFCKIVHGEIPCAKIHETDTMLVFMDIAPVRKGHALIIPKAHYPTLFEVPAEIGTELIATMKTVGKAIMDATGATGLNVGQNCFEDAGQVVFHAHWHLIPRFSDDGIKMWGQTSYDSNDEMVALASTIAKHIQG